MVTLSSTVSPTRMLARCPATSVAVNAWVATNRPSAHKLSTVSLTAPVPANETASVGVVMRVWSSLLELPLSLAASKSGLPGALGRTPRATDFTLVSPRSSLILKLSAVVPTVCAEKDTPELSAWFKKALICSAVPRKTSEAVPQPVAVTPCKSVPAVRVKVPNAAAGDKLTDSGPPSASATNKPLRATA